MKTRLTAVALLLGLLAVASPARAEIQTQGRETWPGKITLGVHPLGGQIAFNPFVGEGAGLYKLGLDIAGKLLDGEKITLWLGGEINVGGVANLAMIEPGLFVRITLEKLLNIPLVPFVQAGVSGQVFAYYGNALIGTYGAFLVKVGAGLHYYLTKNVGLGLQTDFGFGAAFGGNLNGSSFVGNWDILAGVQFAF